MTANSTSHMGFQTWPFLPVGLPPSLPPSVPSSLSGQGNTQVSTYLSERWARLPTFLLFLLCPQPLASPDTSPQSWPVTWRGCHPRPFQLRLSVLILPWPSALLSPLISFWVMSMYTPIIASNLTVIPNSPPPAPDFPSGSQVWVLNKGCLPQRLRLLESSSSPTPAPPASPHLLLHPSHHHGLTQTQLGLSLAHQSAHTLSHLKLTPSHSQTQLSPTSLFCCCSGQVASPLKPCSAWPWPHTFLVSD